jgi:hypothetical protein
LVVVSPLTYARCLDYEGCWWKYTGSLEEGMVQVHDHSTLVKLINKESFVEPLSVCYVGFKEKIPALSIPA